MAERWLFLDEENDFMRRKMGLVGLYGRKPGQKWIDSFWMALRPLSRPWGVVQGEEAQWHACLYVSVKW